ncbi:MAG: CoA transferase, partial [Candidatus Binatia bacterium]|nr:CoA transferase [Candidatus Binatia bacterium]
MSDRLEPQKGEKRPQQEGKGPLKGLRVLDLGHAGAGPMGPTFLAEWGAEVVKVESPEGGNIFRRIPPLHNGQSFWFPIEARHKKSLAIDLHTEDGQRAIKELAKEFDVVLENFRPGTMERWGLDYEKLKQQREDIILIRVSGFGQEGPYRRRTSYDTVGAAMGGVFHLTGHPDGSPALLGTGMCDYLTAAFNALASLIAIYYRNKTGKGQWADIPQYEAIFRLCEWTAAAYDKLGLVRERTGNRHPSIAPSDLYQTRDGQRVSIEVVNDKIFTRLCHAIGRNDLPSDPHFTTAAKRADNSETINKIVADWVGQKELKEVVDTMSEAQVPSGPVCSPKEILEDVHVRARKSVIDVDDPVMGELTVQNMVGRFSRTPAEVRDTGVSLGADNEEILREWLHFSQEEMAAAIKGERKEQPERMDQPASKGEPSGEMALSDLRVLELGSGLGGSFAATLLAD